MKKKTNNHSISVFPSEPKPRTVVTNFNGIKWKGCIYFSAFDHTGQILQYLANNPLEKPKELKGIPLWVFISKDKSEIESKISETIQLNLKKNRLLTINLN